MTCIALYMSDNYSRYEANLTTIKDSYSISSNYTVAGIYPTQVRIPSHVLLDSRSVLCKYLISIAG